MLSSFRYTISTHTPARGVTVRTGGYVTFAGHFNPHSRKGSDIRLFKAACAPAISTHTPARGVTCVANLSLTYTIISTHTPARGVTVKQTIFHLNIFLFFTQFTSFFHQTSPYFHFISFFTQNPGENLPVVLMSLLIRT